MFTTTILDHSEQVGEWRRELALTIWTLRSAGRHVGLCKDQVLHLAATLCQWESLEEFRQQCDV